MKFYMLLGSLIFTVLLSSNSVLAKTIHKERSIYRNIIITEKNHKRCMRFDSRKKTISSQACMDLNNKDHLYFEYTRSIMAGLAFNPQPKRVLIIGLGGGSLPRAFSKILPNTEVVSIEIDPAVVKLAKKYFDYVESETIKTHVRDGRVFIKRAIKKQQQFDWIILDAFNGEYIPEHLLTTDFLVEVKTLLSPNGLLSANTFNGSKLYDHESVTYQKVFGNLMILKSPTKGNRIIFACNCQHIQKKFFARDELQKKLETIGVDLSSLVPLINEKVDWDTNAQPLTDQYSPANLLNQ